MRARQCVCIHVTHILTLSRLTKGRNIGFVQRWFPFLGNVFLLVVFVTNETLNLDVTLRAMESVWNGCLVDGATPTKENQSARFNR